MWESGPQWASQTSKDLKASKYKHPAGFGIASFVSLAGFGTQNFEQRSRGDAPKQCPPALDLKARLKACQTTQAEEKR